MNNTKGYIDTHCHLDLCVQRGETFTHLMAETQDANISALIVPGLHPLQWSEAFKMSTKQHPIILFCIGLHPWWIEQYMTTHSITHLEEVLANTNLQNVIGIGECGLDAKINTHLDLQQRLLEIQISFAIEHRLPLMLHNRQANQTLLEMLKHHKPPMGGVIHAFSGSYQLAKQFWDKGFYLGVGGTVTYPRAKKTREAIARMPMQALVLETDAPDMPVQGHQGKPNTPARLTHVAAAVAELKHISIENVRAATTRNAISCFRLETKPHLMTL